MGYWTRAETELLINLEGKDPSQASVYTNWPKFASRLGECEGFDKATEWEPTAGGREISGGLSLAPYRYLYLRRSLGEASKEEFDRRKELLPEAVFKQTAFRLGTGERETCLQACLDDPYWLNICSDMNWWLKRLEDNPWAVLLEEQRYSGSDDGGIDYMRSYAVPLRLLQIRKKRPHISDEQKRLRSERLGISS